MQRMIFLAVNFASFVSCTSPKDASDYTVKASTIALKAGEGYDSLRVRFPNQVCINATYDPQPSTKRFSNLRKVDSSTDLSKIMGYKAEGSFSYGLAKGDLKANMLVESQSSERSVGYITYSYIVSRVERAMNPKIADDYSVERCGDKFVSEVSYGSELTVKINFNFSSNKFKRRFETGGGGSYGDIGQIKAHVETLDEVTKNNSSMSFSIEALGTNLNAKDDILGGQSVASCSLSNFKECNTILDKIIHYQLNSLPAQAAVSQTVIDYELDDYPEKRTKIDSQLSEKRFRIHNLLETTAKDLIRVRSLISLNIFDGQDLTDLQRIEGSIRENNNRIRNEMINCFDNPEQCNENIQLSSYNRDSLMIREKTYNINVTYGESGVTGCRERVIDNLRKQCQEKAGAMLGEVAEFDVRDIHFRKEKDLTNAKNNFRGRFCDYDADRASCFIRVQY
jgi:hypothetical protein